MNKLIVVTALFACVLAFAIAARADDDAPEPGVDQDSPEEGYLRNPVGKASTDLWGMDIHEKGLPKAVESKTALCNKFMSKDECKTCCKGKQKAWEYNRFLRKCTCRETNNHYIAQ